jgi:hypothetical protein
MKTKIAAVIILLGATPAEACHRYSRWYYPTPQQCRFNAYAPRIRLRNDPLPVQPKLTAQSLPTLYPNDILNQEMSALVFMYDLIPNIPTDMLLELLRRDNALERLKVQMQKDQK